MSEPYRGATLAFQTAIGGLVFGLLLVTPGVADIAKPIVLVAFVWWIFLRPLGLPSRGTVEATADNADEPWPPSGVDDESTNGIDYDDDYPEAAPLYEDEGDDATHETPPRVANPEIVAALETLGISGTRVPWSAVASRYRELAKQYHPDRYSGLELPSEMIRTAEEQFTRITAAYETLQRYRRPL